MITTFKLGELPAVLIIGRRICSSGWQYQSHTIRNFELMLVYQGIIHTELDGSRYLLKKGDCLLLKPGQVYSSHTQESCPCRYYIVHFTLDYDWTRIDEKAVYEYTRDIISEDVCGYTDDIYSMPHISLKEIFLKEKMTLDNKAGDIFSVLEKALTEKNSLGISNDLLLSCYLSEVLVLLTRLTLESLGLGLFSDKNKKTPVLLIDALYYIHDNYSKAISVKDIAVRLSVSPQYLIRVFNAYIGMTPLQYLNSFRINRAKELLRHTGLTVKEISYEVGINDTHYFCRLFKNKLKTTPSEYRQS